LRRDVYVGESSWEDQAVLEHAPGRNYRGMIGEVLPAGSIDEITEQLRSLGELGYIDILVRHLTDD
jgi:uncharacterized NAD-dependent epimerase/dehydratase family protein